MELSDWGKRLKQDWNERAASSRRDFFIASIPKWDDADALAEQTAIDLELLSAKVDWPVRQVLEIGAGTGRFSQVFGPSVSYTGIDISGELVADCRAKFGHNDQIRFFESDGHTLPEEACDRHYDLIFALGVFIHCPAPVIAATLQAALPRLARPASLRFQVLADPSDDELLAAPEPQDEGMQDQLREVGEAADRDEEIVKLTRERYYRGDAFRVRDIREQLTQLSSAVDGSFELHRFDPHLMYCDLRVAAREASAEG